MSDEAWNAGFVKSLGVRLAGDLIGDVDERGEPLIGDTLMLLLNAHHESIQFALPAPKAGYRWERLVDTADGSRRPAPLAPDDHYDLAGRSLSLVVMRPLAETSASSGGEAMDRESASREDQAPHVEATR